MPRFNRLVKYSKEYVTRNAGRDVMRQVEKGKEVIEKEAWNRIYKAIYSVVGLVTGALVVAFSKSWAAFAAAHVAIALGVYVTGGILAVAVVLFLVVPVIRQRIKAYSEASDVREDFETLLKTHDEERKKETLKAFRSLENVDSRSGVTQYQDKIKAIFLDAVDKLGIEVDQLLDLSPQDPHYQLAKDFLYHANELFFNPARQTEITSAMTEEEIDELNDILSDLEFHEGKIDVDLVSEKTLHVMEGISRENKKLMTKESRGKLYDRLTSGQQNFKLGESNIEGSISGKKFLHLVKIALNELYVADRIQANELSKVLFIEKDGITPQDIERAVAYKRALFDHGKNPRHKLLGKVFLGKSRGLSQDELEFIYCIMDKVHRGKLHWYKRGEDSYGKESYIDLINSYAPRKQFKVDDALESCVHMIQCVDSMKSVLDRDDKPFGHPLESQGIEHGEHIADEDNDRERLTRQPIYEDDDGDQEGRSLR